MKLKEMSKADLELLSYCDITDLLLKENKKPMNTPALFKNICSLLELSDSEYADKIGQFYTSLTTDKRFVLLDSAEWDLKDNHVLKKIVIDDDEDDDEEETEYEEEYETEEELDDLDSENVEEPIDDEELDTDDDIDDELEDLSIVDEEEELGE